MWAWMNFYDRGMTPAGVCAAPSRIPGSGTARHVAARDKAAAKLFDPECVYDEYRREYRSEYRRGRLNPNMRQPNMRKPNTRKRLGVCLFA